MHTSGTLSSGAYWRVIGPRTAQNGLGVSQCHLGPKRRSVAIGAGGSACLCQIGQRPCCAVVRALTSRAHVRSRAGGTCCRPVQSLVQDPPASFVPSDTPCAGVGSVPVTRPDPRILYQLWSDQRLGLASWPNPCRVKPSPRERRNGSSKIPGVRKLLDNKIVRTLTIQITGYASGPRPTPVEGKRLDTAIGRTIG